MIIQVLSALSVGESFSCVISYELKVTRVSCLTDLIIYFFFSFIVVFFPISPDGWIGGTFIDMA